jgi:hypothetical protein
MVEAWQIRFETCNVHVLRRQNECTACSFGWWLMAGADLL